MHFGVIVYIMALSLVGTRFLISRPNIDCKSPKPLFFWPRKALYYRSSTFFSCFWTKSSFCSTYAEKNGLLFIRNTLNHCQIKFFFEKRKIAIECWRCLSFILGQFFLRNICSMTFLDFFIWLCKDNDFDLSYLLK